MNIEGSYSDTLVKVKPGNGKYFLRYFIFVMCFVLLFVAAVILKSVIWLIIAIAVDVVLLYLVPSTKVEYEYVYVDGQIDFDRIIAGNSRKNMFRTDIENAIKICPASSHSLDQFKSLPMKDFSTKDPEDRHFVIVAKADKGQYMVKFTPDEKLLDEIKEKAPFKFQMN